MDFSLLVENRLLSLLVGGGRLICIGVRGGGRDGKELDVLFKRSHFCSQGTLHALPLLLHLQAQLLNLGPTPFYLGKQPRLDPLQLHRQFTTFPLQPALQLVHPPSHLLPCHLHLLQTLSPFLYHLPPGNIN